MLNVNLQSHLQLKDPAPGAGPTLGFHFQCVQLRDDHKHQAGVIPWVRLPTIMLQTTNYNLHLHGSNSYIINHFVGGFKRF